MVYLILWLFILGTMLVVYLYFPFLRDNHVFPEVDSDEARIQALTVEREQSFAALADLDEDYETGKLSYKDYQKLRTELLQETAKIVGQLENATDSQLENATEISVESEIERYKQQRQR